MKKKRKMNLKRRKMMMIDDFISIIIYLKSFKILL